MLSRQNLLHLHTMTKTAMVVATISTNEARESITIKLLPTSITKGTLTSEHVLGVQLHHLTPVHLMSVRGSLIIDTGLADVVVAGETEQIPDILAHELGADETMDFRRVGRIGESSYLQLILDAIGRYFAMQVVHYGIAYRHA